MKFKKLFLVFYIIILFSTITFVSASRLPTVDGDEDTWGTVLNDFLSRIAGTDATELNQTMVNGTNIYSSSINTSHIKDGTITADDLGTSSVADDEIDYTAVTLADLTNDVNYLDKDEGGTINGSLIINGNLSLIGSYLNATVTNQYLNGSFLPSITSLFDIGSSTFRWNDLFATNVFLSGDLNVSSIFATDWSNVTITESQVSDADWWDADGDLSADEISEANINFATSCGAGNHLYINGNDLACETDATGMWTNSSGNATFTSGRVGIGTTAPLGNLHINESSGVTPSIPTNYDNVIIQNNDDASDDVGMTFIAGSSAECGIDFGNNESSNAGGITYSHQTLSMTLQTNDATRITINGVGDTGIGTVPVSAARLAIRAKNTDDLLNLIETDGDEVFTVLESGFVGIGAPAPTHELNVVGNANITGNLTLGEKINFALGEVIDNIVDGWITITGGLNVTENLEIGGNVTINRLVSKNGNISFYNNTGNENVRITNDGKVGIGTSNPTHELNVVGDANVTGVVYSTKDVQEVYNTSIGASGDTITTTNTLATIQSNYNAIYVFVNSSIHHTSMYIDTDDLQAGDTYEMAKYDTRYVVIQAPTTTSSSTWTITYSGVTISYVRIKGIY